MTKETVLNNKIKLDCGKRGWVCFHFNPGKKHLIDNT